MRISDWSSDVCSSDLIVRIADSVWQDCFGINFVLFDRPIRVHSSRSADRRAFFYGCQLPRACRRSEEHTSELQSLMRISYAVFCLKKKKLLPIDAPYYYTTCYNHVCLHLIDTHVYS